MATNLFVLLFYSVLVGLLYYFRLRRAKSTAEVGRLALAFAFIGIFFLANAFFAYLGRQALLAAVETPPILSAEDLAGVKTGAPVILDGRVSPENPVYTANYVTYVECNDETCTRYVPSELLIALDGGDIAISNDDFQDRAWPFSSGGVRFLAPETAVIVVGTMERGVVIFGPDRGKELASIRADILFAGTHEDFVARSSRRVILPTVMVIVNLVAVATVIVLPWISWYSRRDKKPADQAE